MVATPFLGYTENPAVAGSEPCDRPMGLDRRWREISLSTSLNVEGGFMTTAMSASVADSKKVVHDMEEHTCVKVGKTHEWLVKVVTGVNYIKQGTLKRTQILDKIIHEIACYDAAAAESALAGGSAVAGESDPVPGESDPMLEQRRTFTFNCNSIY